MRRRLVILALSLTAALAATATVSGTAGAIPMAHAAAKPKASYLEVVDDVMCVVCHEPLGVAQSPEAFQERDYIRQLIAQGKTRKEIESDLVQQYGPAVLSRPPAHGVKLFLGIATIAVFIPRWRRRARQSGSDTAGPAAALDPADAKRLNEDLGRFA